MKLYRKIFSNTIWQKKLKLATVWRQFLTYLNPGYLSLQERYEIMFQGVSYQELSLLSHFSPWSLP